jgi:GNAT superfamily N-acetyltransferase
MRPVVTLGPATRDHAAAIVRAFEWLFAPPGSKPADWDEDQALRRAREVITNENSDVLVAELAGELVGFCSVALDLRSIRFGQRAWVEDLAVAPAHRSAGIGKALLDAAKAWAREHGADHLELDSGDGRVDAHRFYRREGASWESRGFGWVLDG